LRCCSVQWLKKPIPKEVPVKKRLELRNFLYDPITRGKGFSSKASSSSAQVRPGEIRKEDAKNQSLILEVSAKENEPPQGKFPLPDLHLMNAYD